MPMSEGINYRRADAKDVFPLLNLYQRTTAGEPSDPILLDAKKVAATLACDNQAWVVADRDGELLALISISIDRDNRLAQMTRVYVDPAWQESENLLRNAMPLLVGYLKTKTVEVIFTNTRGLSEHQQELAMEMGFKVMGVFPASAAQNLGALKLNGLLAYFFEGVLEREHRAEALLHPRIAPFYRIVREQTGTAELPIADALGAPVTFNRVPVPELEIIHAPKFALHRFERLKSKASLATSFYPFQEPNAIVTDPAQRIEIFVRIVPEKRAAAIIGERLDIAVDPAELYGRVAWLLNARNINYIEVINDASDPVGIESLMQAGFLPCAYFPCFKSHGEQRRDYVIFARPFERLFGAIPSHMEVNRTYLAFLREYYILEGQTYLDKLHAH